MRIESVRAIIGMEVHVELATRTKMFSRCPSPACEEFGEAGPNTLIDPTVLGLPGALPVMNGEAVELSMLVGMALGCVVAAVSKWDRKSYFYPDLPKAYQISQYDLPLCFDGAVDVPGLDERGQFDFSKEWRRIGIVRAHLEEDAGKLLHEAPGGGAIDHSICDWNRAGTPLLEIVTQPEFDSADRCVAFARLLRDACRFLGATLGVMQKGHMRFEPNVNVELTLEGGKTVRTPIVEVKNLNSFKALRGAVEHEIAEQPGRWLADGVQAGPGKKSTRGWDDARGVTTPQRKKEDAHDYRYFPDPDLPPVRVDAAWRDRVRERLVELPISRMRRYAEEYGLGVKEATALAEERGTCEYYEEAVARMTRGGVERVRAGKVAANLVLQSGMRRANERGVAVEKLGVPAEGLAEIGVLREQGRIGNQAVEQVFDAMCEGGGGSAEAIAGRLGLLIVRDDAALDGWVDRVIGANPKAAEDVRAGKVQAAGRLVGEVMKLAGGAADAKTVREAILKKLRG